MNWEVWRRGPQGGAGVKLGTVEAKNQADAVTAAMSEYARVGLNAKNIEVFRLGSRPYLDS